MRTHDGYDAQDSYERARDAMGENVRNRNDDIGDGQWIELSTADELWSTEPAVGSLPAIAAV